MQSKRRLFAKLGEDGRGHRDGISFVSWVSVPGVVMKRQIRPGPASSTGRPAPVPAPRAQAAGPDLLGGASLLLLQRAAGNAAVVSLVMQREPKGKDKLSGLGGEHAVGRFISGERKALADWRP